MFIRATKNFKPSDPATHIKIKQGEKFLGKVLIISTPDDQLVPYLPEEHNDATQANGIREGFTIIPMTHKTFYKNLQNPTQEEIDRFFSLSENDAYVAEGFDPSKGDANTKWDAKLGHTKETKILVLEKKFFCGGYEPYKPSQHGENENPFKSITVNNYRVTRSKVQAKRSEKNNNTIANSSFARLSSPQRIPTQKEIAIIKSDEIDAYLAEGFDPSKGDANEKYDSRIHGENDKILVLENKIFGGGFEPYKLSQNNENEKPFQSITATYYRSSRSAARKAYIVYLVKNKITDPDIDTTPTTLFPRPPTQREIDIFTAPKINAYVAKTFDPSKGDDNEKYSSKICRTDEILVIKKTLFGGGLEPYIPSKHGKNEDDYKKVSVGYFYTARNKSRNAYDLWKLCNPNSASATTTTTTSDTTPTILNGEVEAARALTFFLECLDFNPNTLFSTSATRDTSNQVVGPEDFNSTILVHDSEQVSETNEQESASSVTSLQTGSTSQPRKRTADDSVLNSTLSLNSSSFALFQEAVPPVVKDPTEPKRLRPMNSIS